MNGQERKRRLQRRKNRESEEAAMHHALTRVNASSDDLQSSEIDRSLLINDVVPRELREELEKEHHDSYDNR